MSTRLLHSWNAALVLPPLLCACTATALAQVPEYHVTAMGPMIEDLFPGVQYLSSQSRGMNENGDVVGDAYVGGSQQNAWIYTVEHGVVALPLVPGFTSNVALDVNDRDAAGEVVIVGGGVPSIYWDLYLGVAALWRFSTVTGEVIETRVIGNLPGLDEGIAIGANNNGKVVGYCLATAASSPFKYDVDTGMLEPFDFPAYPADLNNVGQVVGGRYVGDLDGNYTQMGIPPDCTSLTLTGINDRGWLVGRAGRPYTDGAGRFLANWVRYTDAGWHVPNPGSPWDTGFEINYDGDITIGYGPGWDGGYYIADTANEFWLNAGLPPETACRYDFAYAYGINDHRQVAASSLHAVLLTPVGSMIIPGDVNGDAQVNFDDHCDWLANPIDLDGDGDADADDEQWLIDRLAVFGFIVQDCNGNGLNDHCDITSGASSDCDENGAPDECDPDCSGDGVPDACEPDCNGNGIDDYCDIDSGLSVDCNGDGIPDECDHASATEVMNVFEPPVLLWAGAVVSDDLLVRQEGLVEDIDFTIDIDYRIGDLTVLLSHNGTTITLIDRPGHPDYILGNGQLGYDIVLDDDGLGGPIENRGNFGPPFVKIYSPPSYQPNDPLSTFNGMPSEGVWTVTIMTTSVGCPPADFFSDWGLSITNAVVPLGACEGDFNGDGVVDLADLSILLADYGCTPPGPCVGDIDGDGDTDLGDLSILLSNYGS